MNNSFILLALIVLISPLVLGRRKDYCSGVYRKACQYKGEHIGCRPKDFKHYATCRNNHPKIVSMKRSYKKFILKRHNELRNLLASGSMSSTNGRFPSAMNMSKLVWDKELAKLAELNVKQCRMNHDRCRSTAKFPDAGQNIFYSSWSQKRSKDKRQLIAAAIKNWWDEHNSFYINEVSHFEARSHGVSHFTAMAVDYQTHIGCAISQYDYAGTGDTFLMTCNYSSWTWLNQPLYKKGRPCSMCRKCDKKYRSLCKSR